MPDAHSSVEESFLSPAGVRIASSSFGSILTAFAVTPLDVVKVRLQALQSTPSAQNALGECSRCGLFVLNTGLIHGEVMLNKLKSPHFRCVSAEAASERIGGAFAAAAASIRGTTNSAITREASSLATCGCPPGLAASTVSTLAPRTPVASMPTSTVPALAHIFRTEGFAGIYSGLFPTLIMAVPATVLYFSAYDDFKVRLGPVVGSDLTPPLAGMTARILASAVTSPFELVRTIMQTGEAAALVASQTRSPLPAGAPPSSPTTLGSFRALVRVGGVPALWRGLEPTLWRDVPFSAMYWFAFERGKKALEQADAERWWMVPRLLLADDSPLACAARSFVAGAGSGVIAATLTTPMDVVKTRRQLYSAIGSEAAGSSSATNGNGSTPAVMRAIWREEGLGGLMSGLRPRILKIAPACAIMISSYEAGKRAFGLRD